MPKNWKTHGSGAIALWILLVLLSACIGPQNNLSDKVDAPKTDPTKIIVIPLFYNATLEPILEKELTRIFKETFFAQGWQVETKQTDDKKTLSGQITAFSVVPTALGLTGGAREYQVQIAMDIEVLQGNKENKVLKTNVEGIADYVVRPNSAADRAAKNRAIREAGREMAERVSAFLEMPLRKKE